MRRLVLTCTAVALGVALSPVVPTASGMTAAPRDTFPARIELPDGFQRAEFLLERGFLDGIVDRRELKAYLALTLRLLLGLPAPQRQLPASAPPEPAAAAPATVSE